MKFLLLAGRLLTALIGEYLEWAQLGHTLKVYLPECNLVIMWTFLSYVAVFLSQETSYTEMVDLLFFYYIPVLQPKDFWRDELKDFSSTNRYDSNRNGECGPLLLDVLEGYLKYEVWFPYVAFFSCFTVKNILNEIYRKMVIADLLESWCTWYYSYSFSKTMICLLSSDSFLSFYFYFLLILKEKFCYIYQMEYLYVLCCVVLSSWYNKFNWSARFNMPWLNSVVLVIYQVLFLASLLRKPYRSCMLNIFLIF